MAKEVPDASKVITTDFEWQRTFSSGDDDTKTVTTTNNDFEIFALMQDHTEGGLGVVGFVSRNDTLTPGDYELYFGYEEDVIDPDTGDVLQAKGFSNAVLLATISIESLAPGEIASGPIANQSYRTFKFWIISKAISVVDGEIVNKSVYGLDFGGDNQLDSANIGYPHLMGSYTVADGFEESFRVKQTTGSPWANKKSYSYNYGSWVGLVIFNLSLASQGTTTKFIKVSKGTEAKIVNYGSLKDITKEEFKPSGVEVFEHEIGAVNHTAGGVIAGGVL